MTDPIAEGVKLVPQLKRDLVNDPVHGKGLRGSAMNYDVVETIIAALTAAGEMAEKRHTIAEWKDLSSKAQQDVCYQLQNFEFPKQQQLEIAEAAYGVIRKIMLSTAPPSPTGEDVVEKVVRAFKAVLLDIDFLIERGHLTDIRNDMIYTEARAALAAIGER